MVRFGNVQTVWFGGSAVSETDRWGPITLTHPDIIRYFMTISEAASLVLHASVLAKGGDVLLLDMGEPVRIKDLLSVWCSSGLSLRDPTSPSGDIEIRCTGLRPGEKLYEELLIDAEAQQQRIPDFSGRERSLSADELWNKLQALETAITLQDEEQSLKLLASLVPEWRRQEPGQL